jgi:hypothetical protein
MITTRGAHGNDIFLQNHMAQKDKSPVPEHMGRSAHYKEPYQPGLLPDQAELSPKGLTGGIHRTGRQSFRRCGKTSSKRESRSLKLSIGGHSSQSSSRAAMSAPPSYLVVWVSWLAGISSRRVLKSFQQITMTVRRTRASGTTHRRSQCRKQPVALEEDAFDLQRPGYFRLLRLSGSPARPYYTGAQTRETINGPKIPPDMVGSAVNGFILPGFGDNFPHRA